jgi:hypothetical protein
MWAINGFTLTTSPVKDISKYYFPALSGGLRQCGRAY